MNWNSGGLRIATCPQGDQPELHSVAAGIPVHFLLFAGLALTGKAWFPDIGLPWWVLWLGMGLFSGLLSLLRLTGKGKWVHMGVPIAVLVLCLVLRRFIAGGMALLGNDLLAQLTRRTGRIYLDFGASEGSHRIWGLLPVLALITWLQSMGCRQGKLRFLLPMVVPVYLAVFTGLYPICVGTVLLTLSCLFLLMNRAAAGEQAPGFRGIPSRLAIVALCIAISLGAGAAIGTSDTAQEDWDRYFHRIFSHRETNSMPEGQLKNLPPWNKSDTPALKITMSEPQKLYLRGQIYESYDGSAWRCVSTEELAAQENLFYWLHTSGFYGQSQIGTAETLTGQTEPESLTVENLSACAAQGYYPYALGSSVTLEADRIGDTGLPQTQQMTYYPGSVPRWYSIQHELASGQDQEGVQNYLTLEEAYEAFLLETDLQLTPESWAALDRQLGEDDAPKTLSQIRDYIRTYLEENLVYDETVRTLNGSSDFLQYTLEGSGSGYSVHYATAATLMLRYFGVPARYVEGYFLPGEEADQYQAGQEILLTENHAHAWAEYYLPGVGFIPFEVTPGYLDDEELELGGALAQSAQTYTADHLKYAQVEQPEKIEEPKQNRFSFSMKPVHLLYLLGVAVLALVVLIFVKRKKLQRALKSIDEAPNRDAIALRFGYVVRLLDCCAGVQVDNGLRARELNREALFSNHEMTDLQRQEMDTYAGCVLTACKEKWTVLQKLRYRLWDCLY